MKLLTAVIFVLAMATSAMALECPDDSLNIFYDDGTNYGFSYSCDDGSQTRVVKLEQGASEARVVEVLLGKSCIQVREMLICR